MENTNNTYRTITILIGLILIAGIAFYVFKAKAPATTQEAVKTETESASSTSAFLETLNSALSEEEKILLSVSGKTVTKAEGDLKFELASKLAVEGKEITVTNCVAKPVVLKVKNGTTITVINNGFADFPFGFDADKVNVPSKGSISYKINFKSGQGLYGYGCDNKEVQRGVGLILVTP